MLKYLYTHVCVYNNTHTHTLKYLVLLPELHFGLHVDVCLRVHSTGFLNISAGE